MPVLGAFLVLPHFGRQRGYGSHAAGRRIAKHLPYMLIA